MFLRDQSAIERWCKNPDKVVDVGLMVLLSIRMQWTGVGTQLTDVRKHGLESKCLWGFKRAGYTYLLENKRSLYATVRDLRAKRISVRAFIRQWLKVPGLGIVKASFVAQLTCGQAGCLDMHNIARYGLDEKSWIVPRRANIAVQMQAIDDTIDLYLSICRLCGGPENLWDDWCDTLALKVSTFENGDDVSRRHYDYLVRNNYE